MTVDENEVQLQLYARAPAPSRDYYGLTITQSKIILNIWNISYGPHVYPKRHVSSLEDFSDQRSMQHDIQRTFGDYALHFANGFAAKERNLQYLPMKVFLKIVRCLATNDILRLSQTSKVFFDICNSEAVWRVIYKKKIKRRVLLSDIEKGTEIGWKQALKSKIMSRVTLRNLLDKNEGKMRPSSAAAQQKNQMNNLTSSTTPNIISKKPSVPNVSRVMTNPNTSISNRSSTNLIKNPRDIPQEGGRRYTKSAVSLQKSTISSKIDTRDHAKSCLGIQKDAIPERELTLPINKTKLLQSSATVRSGSGEKNLNNDLDGLLGKANRTFQTKFEKSLNKSYMVGKKGANKK